MTGLFQLFSGIILLYAVNNLYLIWATRKYVEKEPQVLERFPRVSVQLPIYNEQEVVSRLIESVSKLRWPREALEILILDDSDDETRKIIDEKVSGTQLDIRVIRREKREGFKAGALQRGLMETEAEYIAIFDADFLPDEDFLTKVIPVLEGDEDIGLVQTRWGHLNPEYNQLTKAIALSLDLHHCIEQVGRNSSDLFINFNGSCGVFRKKAMLEAGGWRSVTLSEDLDISYRIQLEHWKAVYKRDIIVPGEVPPNIHDYRAQQQKWAKGSIQCSKLLMGKVLRSDFRLRQKVEAILHLNSYSVYLFTVLLLLVSVPALLLEKTAKEVAFNSLGYIGLIGVISQMAVFTVLWRKKQGSSLSFCRDFLFLFITSLGLSIDCGTAIIHGLIEKGGVFLKTPKYNIKDKDTVKKQRFQKKMIASELIIAAFTVCGIIITFFTQSWGMMLYLSIHALGFCTVILLSVKPELF